MVEKEINGKTYNINVITYMQALEVEEAKTTGIKESAKKFIQFATGLTDEEVEKLSIKDGLALQQAVNKLNLDFQEPAKE